MPKEMLTFDLKAAQAAWDAGCRDLLVMRKGAWRSALQAPCNEVEYALVEGYAPTADVVSAIVKAEPDRLCRVANNAYAWIDDDWMLWAGDGGWIPCMGPLEAGTLAIRPDYREDRGATPDVRTVNTLPEVVAHGWTMPGMVCGVDADGREIMVDAGEWGAQILLRKKEPLGVWHHSYVRYPVTLRIPPKPEVEPQAGSDDVSPDDIRKMGWSVAVHNDYRLNGEPHTFWLFTKDGRCVKGEGRTDAEALREVRDAIVIYGRIHE